MAVVDKNVDAAGTRELAEAYLQLLYSDAAQRLVAEHHFRPRSPAVLAQFASKFPAIPLATIDDTFGGWAAAQRTHFDEGGVFDQILTRR